MRPNASARLLASGILRGDRHALARGITVVENRRSDYHELLARVFPHTGNAHIVGLTGPPGVGKSTLGNGVIRHMRLGGVSVGLIAVDPSSPFGNGSLLGDRIRMQEHSSDLNVFIRSMSNRGRLGGLASASSQAVSLLDAAGFDPILVETVGVGQAEVEIATAADTTVVVLPPQFGDGIQAEKAGLLEIADVLCVNQADTGKATEAIRMLNSMLDRSVDRGWRPPILATNAITGEGVADMVTQIYRHREVMVDSGELDRRRRIRLRKQLELAVGEAWMSALDDPDEAATGILSALDRREIDPWTAARQMLGQ